MTAAVTFTVWLAAATATVAHRDRECPRLTNRPDHCGRPQSVSATTSTEPGYVEVPNLMHPRKPRRTVKLCLGCVVVTA